MRVKIFCIFLLLLSLFTVSGYCQEIYENELGWREEDRIGRAVESFVQRHKYRFGIFRFQPRLSLRAGFDGNATFGNETENRRENDFFVAAIPGISGGLKFGTHAYFRILEDLNLVYYFRNENRRDIYPLSLAEFVTGTSKILLTFDGSYYRRRDQVNFEIDEPVEHKVIFGDVIAEYSISPRIEIRHTVRVEKTDFIETPDTIASGIQFFDRRDIRFRTSVGYFLKRTLRLRGDVNFRHSETIETDHIQNIVEGTGGLELRKDRLGALFEAGIGHSRLEDDVHRNNFLVHAKVDYRLRPRLTVGGSISRRFELSFLTDNTSLVQTQIQGNFNAALATRFSLSGHYNFGRNDYGDSIVQGVVVDHDTFQDGDLGLSILVYRGVVLRPGIRYHKRTTNIPGFDKSDFFWFIGFGYGYSFNF
jgi:hypothetical protein